MDNLDFSSVESGALLYRMFDSPVRGWFQFDLKNEVIKVSKGLARTMGLDTQYASFYAFASNVYGEHSLDGMYQMIKAAQHGSVTHEFRMLMPSGDMTLRLTTLEDGSVGDKVIGFMELSEVQNFEPKSSYEAISMAEQLLCNHIETIYKNLPIGYIVVTVVYDIYNRPARCLVRDVNEHAATLLAIKEIDREAMAGGNIDVRTLGLDAEMIRRVQLTKKKEKDSIYIEATDKYCDVTFLSIGNSITIGFLTDITTLYKLNAELYQQNQLFHYLLYNLPFGLEVYNKDGLLEVTNRKNNEIFGVDPEFNLIGLNLFDEPNYPSDLRERLMAEGRVAISTKYDFTDRDYYISSRTEPIDLFVVISAIYSPSGELTNYVVINLDQGETIKAYDYVAELERTLHDVGKTVKVGYCYYDLAINHGTAMPQWLINLGEDVDADVVNVFSNFTHVDEESRDQLKKNIAMIEAGEINNFTMTLRINHTEDQVEWIKLHMINNDTVNSRSDDEHHIISINYNYTSFKQVEESLAETKANAELDNSSKTNFLSDISHEIRTPLNSIIGFSQLMAESDSDDNRAFFTDIVQANNELLLHLISDILDISKIEAGELEFSYGVAFANDICQEVIASARMSDDPRVTFIYVRNAGDKSINTATDRVKQVLSNLISNAVKFTNSGEIKFGYNILDDGRVDFFVSDTGIGISQENIDIIFNPFVKLNQFAQGTGLGLAICKSISDHIGAEMKIESKLEVGTVVHFIV